MFDYIKYYYIPINSDVFVVQFSHHMFDISVEYSAITHDFIIDHKPSFREI